MHVLKRQHSCLQEKHGTLCSDPTWTQGIKIPIAAGRAWKALFWPTLGTREKTSDSSRQSMEGFVLTHSRDKRESPWQQQEEHGRLFWPTLGTRERASDSSRNSTEGSVLTHSGHEREPLTAAGRAGKALFWPTLGTKEKASDASGFITGALKGNYSSRQSMAGSVLTHSLHKTESLWYLWGYQ